MNFKKVVVLPPGATSTASRRKPTPAAEQARLVALWQQSGLSSAAFCDQHQIHPKTFSHWKIKYANTRGHSSHGVTGKAAHAPIALGPIQLQLPNGVTVSFSVEPGELSSLRTILQEVAAWNCS